MSFLNKIINYSILLFVFLIPWQARWIISMGKINGGAWEYGTQSIYATEILLAAILVLVIAKGLSSWREAVGRPIGSQNFFKWILSATRGVASRMIPHQTSLRSVGTGQATLVVVFLFLIYAGLSVFWAIDKNTALIHWRVLVESGAVFLILSSGIVAKNKIQWAIIISAVIQAGWGITQFLMQSIPASTLLGIAHQGAEVLGASVVETATERWLRAYGSFPHPNILGAWLVLGLIIVIRKIQETRYKQILFLYASFVIILFGLLTTFSRAAWLAFGVVLIIWLCHSGLACPPKWRDPESRNKKRNWIPACAGMTTILLIVIIFNSLFPNLLGARIDSQNRLEAKASSERLAGFKQSWQIIKNHPLVGAGIGNYGLAVRDEINPVQPAWYYQPVHNVFLLIWAELGLIGILVIGFWLLVILRQQGRGKLIFYGLPLLILMSFDHYLWSLYSGLMIGAVYLANISRK